MDNGLLLVFIILTTVLSDTGAVPVNQEILETSLQHAAEETGLVYSAANYIFGRWFTTATTTTPTPESIVEEPTIPTTIVTTTTPSSVLYVRTTPVPNLPPKQARGSDLTESTSYPLMKLFMILFRALVENNVGVSSKATASEQKTIEDCKNCPSTQQPPIGQPRTTSSLQSSLSQSAMKAVLMVVSDLLTTQISPNSIQRYPSRRPSGFFWGG